MSTLEVGIILNKGVKLVRPCNFALADWLAGCRLHD